MRPRTETGEPCLFLEGESRCFGLRLATVMRPRLDEEALAWCAERGIDCLSLLCEADDARTARLARERGFRWVGTRVTYRGPIAEPAASPAALLRPAELADVPVLRRIAGRTHELSRFHADPRFDRRACAAYYARRIASSCRGRADAVLVAELEGSAVGYVTLHLRPERVGEIGLLGVDADSRRRGLGRALLERGAAWLRELGCESLVVVTQASNAAARRLYDSFGLRVAEVHHWHHLWLRA